MLPVIPGRSLVLASLAPLGLAFFSLLDPGALGLMLVIDGLILLVAGIDLFWGYALPIRIARHMPSHVSLSRTVKVSLEVENMSDRALDLWITDTLPDVAHCEELPLALHLGPRARETLHYRMSFARRGQVSMGDLRVRWISKLGFWTRQSRFPAECGLRVYPDVKALRQYELLARKNHLQAGQRLTRHRGGDTEFARLRDYQPDDEWRRIDWRATARRSKMTVREFQLERNQSLMLMVDTGRFMTAVFDGLTALDHALNAALMLSHVAVLSGDHVGFLAFSDQPLVLLKPRGGRQVENAIIQACYDLFPESIESDYAAAFKQLRAQVRKRTLVVFLTHAVDEAAAEAIAKQATALLPKHLPLVVLLRDVELEALAHQRASDPRGVAQQAAAAELSHWRLRLLRRLSRQGVLVLDSRPEDLSAAVVSRYLEVKAQGLI